MMMNKKFCFFSAQYLPHLGGVERYTYNLAKKLIAQGYEVIVVTSNTEEPLAREEVTENIKVYRMDCYHLMGDRFPVLKKSNSNRDIYRKLEAENIDMVIVNTRFYLLSLFGVKFAKKHAIPSLLIEHSTGHIEFGNILINKVGQIYDHFITSRIKKYCTDFYGVSVACNNWIKHFHIKAKGTLYNAIDVDHIKHIKATSKPHYREDYNISKESIVITFTGRMIKEKGITELIEAVKKVKLVHKDVYLFLAGDGPLLERLIKEEDISKVFLLGKISFQEVIVLLCETNVFCFPTNYPEGFSTSVLEAAACDCYIITTDRGGSRELLISEEYGVVLNAGKEEYIYSALMETIANKEKLEIAIGNTYKRLMNNFTWINTAERLVQITIEK